MFDVHFDEVEAAEEFLADVRERGIRAELSVDVFAGEDDLEDAARIVHVAGELTSLVPLIEAHGGWPVQTPAMRDTYTRHGKNLPDGPKRYKG